MSIISQKYQLDDGNWLMIPRSNSPEAIDPLHHDDIRPPGLSSSISTGDTRSSSCSSVSTTSNQVPPSSPPKQYQQQHQQHQQEQQPAASEPMKKSHSGRFQNMLHHAGGHIRAGLRMTPMGNHHHHHHHEDQHHPVKNEDDKRRGSQASTKSRRSSASSSLHSYGSAASWKNKLSLSWKQHMNGGGSTSPGSPSTATSDKKKYARLVEKYGPYVKPDTNCKGMGATSKKNVASGATAVIRLVRSNGRILAVKEFKKRDKSESEHDYNKRMENEYSISKTVSGHINVINTLDLVKDERDRWCAVMEYVSSSLFFSFFYGTV